MTVVVLEPEIILVPPCNVTVLAGIVRTVVIVDAGIVDTVLGAVSVITIVGLATVVPGAVTVDPARATVVPETVTVDPGRVTVDSPALTVDVVIIVVVDRPTVNVVEETSVTVVAGALIVSVTVVPPVPLSV